tara:strand:- start:2730 stop:3173 length:444 start_codon:yes stop_codon:yes gene_type:complete
MKLIMENWRNFINEVDSNQDGALQPDELRGLANQLEKPTSKEELMIMISKRISEVGFGQETEEDFDYTKEELCDENSNLCGDIMSITYDDYIEFEKTRQQNSDRENYNLASSVMQHDDSIPLQKKIPSGYGTRGGKKSGQLEFPGLG